MSSIQSRQLTLTASRVTGSMIDEMGTLLGATTAVPRESVGLCRTPDGVRQSLFVVRQR